MSSEQTLVVVFLRGGADGLSIVAPVGDDAYHRARPSTRVAPADTIDLDGYFALHRALEPLHRHFVEGRLAILHGAGSADTTRSHFEAQDFMEHAGDTGGGWLARYLRARGPASSALDAVAIGAVQPESLRGSPGGAVFESIREFAVGGDDPALLEHLARLYAVDPGPLGAAATVTIEAARRLRALRLVDEPPANGASYPDTRFGRGLREIARLVKAEIGVTATTIDMVGGGLGWDTHFLQAQFVPDLLRELGEGLDAFWRDLDRHRERVTTVVMTEFGRRVAENTSFGTDHGSGSVMFVLDENVGTVGRRPAAVESGWRDLSDERLVGPGDVPVTIDYRNVLAGVLGRHAPGLDPEQVFPGLRSANAS
ncbi:MAG: DUF1501 domain-containing protein [Phycisphaerales bacterium]|nr:DUF1501 domain-containing protein [Phycisphaerales bacterium]